MTAPRFLTDEHIPDAFVRTLRSHGWDVSPAKSEFPEGTPDERLLEYCWDDNRIAVTCDKRFSVVGEEPVDDHAGVIYAEQQFLQQNPEEAARGVERTVRLIPERERAGSEFYLQQWV